MQPVHYTELKISNLRGRFSCPSLLPMDFICMDLIGEFHPPTSCSHHYASSTSTSDTPSQHIPPQPFVHLQPQPRNPTPTHHTSPKPHKPQDIQHSPVNSPTQPPISDEEQQCVPKLTNGSQVKCSKPQPRQQDECLCFYCNQLGHLKRNGPKIAYCSKCRTRGHTLDKCTSKPQ